MRQLLKVYWWALTDRHLDYDDQDEGRLAFREAWDIARGMHDFDAKHFVREEDCGCKFRWWGTQLIYCCNHCIPDAPQFFFAEEDLQCHPCGGTGFGPRGPVDEWTADPCSACDGTGIDQYEFAVREKLRDIYDLDI